MSTHVTGRSEAIPQIHITYPAMKNSYNGWHVLYVKPRHEKKVYDLLQEASLESFLPLVKTKRQWSDRKKTILQPLFPSYVFVYINSSLDFYRALTVYGACTYIKFGNEYAIVKDEEINRIKLLLGIDGIEDIQIQNSMIEVGDTKTISFGSLSGLECEVMDVSNANKIIVRIDSLKQNIKATLPLHYLVNS